MSTSTIDKARAVAAVMFGEKPGEVAERHGVTPQTIRAWRESLDSDEELRAALVAALRTSLEGDGWRPRVRRLIVRLCDHLERRLDDEPGALDASETVGAIRALSGAVGEADALARRAGLDSEEEPA